MKNLRGWWRVVTWTFLSSDSSNASRPKRILLLPRESFVETFDYEDSLSPWEFTFAALIFPPMPPHGSRMVATVEWNFSLPLLKMSGRGRINRWPPKLAHWVLVYCYWIYSVQEYLSAYISSCALAGEAGKIVRTCAHGVGRWLQVAPFWCSCTQIMEF